jgi:hypothetical protein
MDCFRPYSDKQTSGGMHLRTQTTIKSIPAVKFHDCLWVECALSTAAARDDSGEMLSMHKARAGNPDGLLVAAGGKMIPK